MELLNSFSMLNPSDLLTEAILDKNARSATLRNIEETKEELDRVLKRVQKIYSLYEAPSKPISSIEDNIEFVNDLAELSVIISDEIKKRKYQQKITVFIVGFDETSHQKLNLLQQLNEFFLLSSKKFDSHDLMPSTPEFDMEEAHSKVERALTNAQGLMQKLSHINRDMINSAAKSAIDKALQKGRKKLEKQLAHATEDLASMKEELTDIQKEMSHRDGKIQQLMRSLELKNVEMQKYKNAAENAKTNTKEVEKLRDELVMCNHTIGELKSSLSKTELEVQQLSYLKEVGDSQKMKAFDENMEKILELQKQVHKKTIAVEEAKRDLEKLHAMQIIQLKSAHDGEISALRKVHEAEIQQLMEPMSASSRRSLSTVKDDTKIYDYEDDESSSKSRTAGESSKQSHTSKLDSSASQQTSEASKSVQSDKATENSNKPPPKVVGNVKIESEPKYADVGVQDEIVTREESLISLQKLPPLNDVDVNDNYEISNDADWSSVPSNQLSVRFSQYRKLAQRKIQNLQNDVVSTTSRTQKKLEAVKLQYQEQKMKWDEERQALIGQLHNLESMRTEAEADTKTALEKLESFIEDQENVDGEEEHKLSSIIVGHVTPGEDIETTDIEIGPKTQSFVDKQTSISEVNVTSENQMSIDDKLKRDAHDISTQMSFTSHRHSLVTPIGEGVVTEFERPEMVEDEIELQSSVKDEEHSGVQEHSNEQICFTDKFIGRMESANGKVPPDRKLVQSAPPICSKPLSVTYSSLRHNEHMKVESEEVMEIRRVSSVSRASLRSLYKSQIEEMRASVMSRQERSRVISIPSGSGAEDIDQDHVEDFEDNYFDNEYNVEEGVKQVDAGTMPRSVSVNSAERKKGIASQLYEEILQDYTKTYNVVMSFKNNLANVLLNKDLMTPSQVVFDLETVSVDENYQFRSSELCDNVSFVLDEIMSVLESVIRIDWEPNVSSLNLMNVSRDTTVIHEAMTSQPPSRPTPSTSAKSLKGHDVTQSPLLNSLRCKCHDLEEKLIEKDRIHEEELKRKLSQENVLQNKISELENKVKESHDQLEQQLQTKKESVLMFTRLDSERNHKIMTQAVLEHKLDSRVFQDTSELMERYVNLPARRFVNLVYKYLHQCHMTLFKFYKDKLTKKENKKVHDFLCKMEDLKQKQILRWSERLKGMKDERINLATDLMDSFISIEQESGIFLIKPYFSYRNSDHLLKPGVKLTRTYSTLATDFNKQSFTHGDLWTVSVGSHRKGSNFIDKDLKTPATHLPPLPNRKTNSELHMIDRISQDEPYPTWNVAKSEKVNEPLLRPHLDTPRLLELDIHRTLVSHNHVSSRASGNVNNVRSYVAIGHNPTPLPALSEIAGIRPQSGKRHHLKDPTRTPKLRAPPGTASDSAIYDVSGCHGLSVYPPQLRTESSLYSHSELSQISQTSKS